MKCSICGENLNGYYGNNPYPIRIADTARCCDECNSRFVIPARLVFAYIKTDDKENNNIIHNLNNYSYEELCEIFVKVLNKHS